MVSDAKLQEIIGFSPFEGQKSVLENINREMVISAGRRWGKSAVCGYLAVKALLEGKRVWIVAPTYDLTHKVFEYAVRFFLKAHPSQGERISYRPYPRIRHLNGGMLECRSTENPTGLLGEEVDLEIIDEASRIPRHIYDTYLYPVTSSRQGRMVIISTPFGKNWFYEHWMAAKQIGGAFQFESRSNPYFPAAEWEIAKQKLPEAVFKREYMAQFLEDSASVFRGVLQIVLKDCLEDSRGDRRYVMGVDLGKVNDFTAIIVIDTYTHKVVYFDRFKEIDWPLQKSRIASVSKRYNKARIVIDSTGVGDPISMDLQRTPEIGVVDDFKISRVTKQQLVEKLSVFIEQKGVYIPDEPVLIDELTAYSYEMTDHGNFRYEAPQGMHDDTVIALALAVWGIQTPKTNNPAYLAIQTPKKRIGKYQFR